MTEKAASRFEIGVEPRFPLDVLRSLRNEVDALLRFLASESKTERPENDAAIRKSPAKQSRISDRLLSIGALGSVHFSTQEPWGGTDHFRFVTMRSYGGE